jgi:methyl-accepting chemotaxis protein
LVQSGSTTVEELDRLLSDTFNQSYPQLQGAYKLIGYLVRLQDLAGTYITQSDAEQLAVIEKKFKKFLKKVTSRLKRLKPRVKSDEGKQLLAKISEGFSKLEANVLADGALFAIYKESLAANAKAVALKGAIAKTNQQYQSALATVANTARELHENVKEAANNEVESALMGTGAIIVLGVVLSPLFGFFLARGILVPVNSLTDSMSKLAEGDNTVDIPSTAGKDEIGQMARAVQVFKDNAIEREWLEAEAMKAAEDVAAHAQRTAELCAEFDKTVSAALEAVNASANEMEATAQAMSATAEQTSKQATTVASASGEATSKVQTVATAAEELSTSIAEIGRQVTQASDISNRAVSEAERTNGTVQGLAEAAQKIGVVVNLINDIASQTNLLALNATIEAARAGEAGKGFTVVASEVKSLANQTAKATDEIAGQISSMQNVTGEVVEAIGDIGKTISEVNGIATSIAAAVEEQSAATEEIARNVQQAAEGTQEASSNIGGITQAAGETGQAAGQVLEAAGDLSRQSDALREEVNKFLADVKAA